LRAAWQSILVSRLLFPYSLAEAEKEAPAFDVKTAMSVQGKDVGAESKEPTAATVPIDSQLVLRDNFVLTPDRLVKNLGHHDPLGQIEPQQEDLLSLR
jgi:hypothetical protein